MNNALLLATLALLLSSCATPPPPTKRPNLLLVVTDDQRFDQMSCAGHPTLQTPAMDRLAAEGVRFTNAFVTTAICAASRASILTGRREGNHGYTFGKPPMGRQLGQTSYPKLLRDAGYRTGFVGKWGVKFEPGALEGAFDYRKGSGHPYRKKDGRHLTDIVTEQAVTFLEQQDDTQPFCLSVSFHAPHAQDNHKDQYLPPDEFVTRYDDADVPIPPLAESGFAAIITGWPLVSTSVLDADDLSSISSRPFAIICSLHVAMLAAFFSARAFLASLYSSPPSGPGRKSFRLGASPLSSS